MRRLAFLTLALGACSYDFASLRGRADASDEGAPGTGGMRGGFAGIGGGAVGPAATGAVTGAGGATNGGGVHSGGSNSATGGGFGSGTGNGGVSSSAGATGTGAGSGSGGAPGTGGTVGSGGAPGTAGKVGSGGASGTGGKVGSGGASGTGGKVGSGGATSSGGVPSSGGVTSTGGAPGSGGVTSTGGAPGSGGTTSTGGVPGSAGATSSGGAPGTGGASPPATVHVTDFADYRVIQRAIGGANQIVVVQGMYGGSGVSAVQAQVVDFATGTNVIVPWTTIAATVSGGTFSGNLTVPQGGWYKLMVRAISAVGGVLIGDMGTHRWGVGINILCMGQSNMVGNGDAHAYTNVTSDLAGLFSNDNVWKHLADPYDGGGSPTEIDYDSWIGASMIPSLVNVLAAQYPAIPIGIVPAARGSAPLRGASNINMNWGYRNPDPANHADVTNLYGNSIANARAVGGVELIVMHQGETDATNMNSHDQYVGDLQLLLAHYREDLYPTIPLFICQLGRSTTAISEKNRTDATVQPIRAAQRDCDDGANVYLAATAIDIDLDPTAPDHYTKTAHDMLGPRIANAIKYRYGNATFYRGPEIAAVAYAGPGKDSIDVTIHHRGGSDFTPSSGINGFQVLDGGVVVTLGAVTRKDASHINIAVAAPIVGIGAVRYLYGKLPIATLTGAVHDNTALQLPLEPTSQDFILP